MHSSRHVHRGSSNNQDAKYSFINRQIKSILYCGGAPLLYACIKRTATQMTAQHIKIMSQPLSCRIGSPPTFPCSLLTWLPPWLSRPQLLTPNELCSKMGQLNKTGSKSISLILCFLLAIHHIGMPSDAGNVPLPHWWDWVHCLSTCIPKSHNLFPQFWADGTWWDKTCRANLLQMNGVVLFLGSPPLFKFIAVLQAPFYWWQTQAWENLTSMSGDLFLILPVHVIIFLFHLEVPKLCNNQ